MINLKQNYTSVFIGLLWLFHISGIIGISLGYLDWFAPKTGLNLLIVLASVIFCFDLLNIKTSIIFICIAIIGFIAEALGVNLGWFFGDYTYGDNLGLKLFGVPVLIGINWAILSFICARISDLFSTYWLSKILIGSILMLILDILMEFNAPKFNFWEFENSSVPLSNYVAWFGFALFFNAIYQWTKVKGQAKISIHIYLVQLVFFMYFYGFYQV